MHDVEDIQKEVDNDEQAGEEPKSSVREQIEALLDEGYTPVQIQKEWGYDQRSVGRVARKRLKPEETQVPTLPMVLKAGGGQEVISPEGILQGYLLGDGDAGVWMFKGMMLLRAAQLMNLTDVEIMKGQSDAQARAIAPILKIMEQAREDQDRAAERARASTEEAAQAAAAGAAARAVQHIDARFEEFRQRKPDIAQSPDPMKGMVARMMESVFERMFSGMLGGGGGGGGTGPTPGLIDERQGGPGS